MNKKLFSLNLLIILVLWVCLFMWRKTFSYINISGLYIIEITIFTCIVIAIFAILVKKKPSILIPKYKREKITIVLSFLFVIYNLIRALFSSDVNIKGLIPGIYPFLFIIIILISLNASPNSKFYVQNNMEKFYAFSFLVPLINTYLVEPYFGILETPGWTYIYGVSLAYSLILIQNNFKSFFIFGITFIFSILAFERASFANFVIALLLIFLSYNYKEKITFLRRTTVKILISIFSLIFVAPFIINNIFEKGNYRFDITTKNIFNFLLSIVRSDVEVTGGFGGLNGTKGHRIEMWQQILGKVFSSFDTTLFGFGYKGEVLDILNVSFRAPHNGFVTILYRGGIFGLFLYLLFLYNAFITFYFNLKYSVSNDFRRINLFAIILIGAFIGDAFTGTIIDSPFTSFLFYTQIGLLITIGSQKKQNII